MTRKTKTSFVQTETDLHKIKWTQDKAILYVDDFHTITVFKTGTVKIGVGFQGEIAHNTKGHLALNHEIKKGHARYLTPPFSTIAALLYYAKAKIAEANDD